MKIFSRFLLLFIGDQSGVADGASAVMDGASGTRGGQRGRRDTAPALRRRRRRYLALLGTGMACLLGPMLVFQITLYRQNLAVARETFPAVPDLSPADRLLVIAPHCDDETLGAGGTIALARRQGLAVRVAFITNGDGSRSTQIEQNARSLRRSSFQELAAMRQRETIAALQELNVARNDIVFLGYPDGGTQTMWQKNWTPDNRFRSKWTGADRSPYKNSMTPDAPYSGAQVLNDIAKLIADFQPTVVFTTHPDDTHPDHWAAYSYTLAALETLRLKSSTQEWVKRTKLRTFLVHHGVWPAPHGYHPEAKLAPPASLLHVGTRWMETPLDREARAAKKAALERYVSQLAFTPHYLRGFLRRNELFGVVPLGSLQMQNGTTSATPKTSILRDPVSDSFVHRLWAGGDIQNIFARQSAPNGAASGQVAANQAGAPSEPALTLRIQAPAGARPSRRLSYRLVLHAITSDDVRAAKVEVQGKDSNLRVTFTPLDTTGGQKTQPLSASRVSDGVKVSIPLRLLASDNEAMSLLVSASTHLGTAHLDQTGTGALRILTSHHLARQQRVPAATARSPHPLPARPLLAHSRANSSPRATAN